MRRSGEGHPVLVGGGADLQDVGHDQTLVRYADE